MITCGGSGSPTPPTELNDLIARATQKRWSPVVLLEHLVAGRTRRPRSGSASNADCGTRASAASSRMADFEWDVAEAAPSPDRRPRLHARLLAKRENVILVAAHGLGKTMLAKNLVHQAILAGHSARFLTAADLILDLTRQDTARALQRRLRSLSRGRSLLAIDEVGYLAYDAHAADLLFQVVSRRYEQKSIVITTNLPFKQWDTVFPNAACAVALIDRLTHHAEIIPIEGESLSQAGGRAGAEGQAKQAAPKPKP